MFFATITGIPQMTSVNARSGPGLNNGIVLRISKGTGNLTVTDVQPDTQGVSQGDKVFNWLQLDTPGGQRVWVRDDLVSVVGDGRKFGYPNIDRPVLGFLLEQREELKATAELDPEEDTQPTPTVQQSAPFFRARILGLPQFPSIREVNVRSGPGVTNTQLFKSAVGTEGLKVLDVETDQRGDSQGGNTFEWMQLHFPNGKSGWVRDDLIEVEGDGTPFGYGVIIPRQRAFDLKRSIPAAKPTVPVVAPETPPAEDLPDVGLGAPIDVEPGKTVEPQGDDAFAESRGATGVNVRSGPGTGFGAVGRLGRGQRAKILGAEQGQGNDPFKWINIEFSGGNGWIREDFARLSGGFQQFGLDYEDKYPAPIRDGDWQRDFNLDESLTNILAIHWGWDFSAPEGMPIYGGPNGGYVVQADFCTRCGQAGVSVTTQGIAVGSSAVLNDPGWNFGYGHKVIVRYLNNMLPPTTRDRLAKRGLAGAHLFVAYAHLKQMNVRAGQNLQPNQQIGTCGNSGNSSGPHLHLEVRAGLNPNETQWFRLIANLMSPEILFLR